MGDVTLLSTSWLIENGTATAWMTDMETTPSADNSTQEELFDLYPHSIVIAIIYITTSIVGVIGNVLVITGVSISPKLRTPTNILIVNLAIADLLTCMALPFQTVGVLSPRNRFPLPDVVCAVVGSVIYVTFTCSAINLVLIASIRCYVITKSIRGYTGLNTPKKLLGLAILAWIMASIYIYVPIYVLDLTEFRYYPPYKQCFTQPTERSDYYHNYLAILIGLHIVAMMSCYIRISCFVRNGRKRFHASFSNSHINSVNRRGENESTNKREMKVTKNLFTIVIAFVICTVPTALSFLIPGAMLVGAYTTAILYFNNCINPILYAFKHPVFQKMATQLFRRILNRLRCRTNENEPRVRSISKVCLQVMNVTQSTITSTSVNDSFEVLNVKI